MNVLAKELNEVIDSNNSYIGEMLSDMGKNLYFPKGILSQSAEAKKKAYALNATIGIATEQDAIMHLPSMMSLIGNMTPETSLTYAPSFGIMPLREKWKEVLVRKNPSLAGINISLPVVASGITHATSIFADMWINPDDVIIVPDKMWGNYILMLDVRQGARFSKFTMFNKDGGFNLDAFEKQVQLEAKTNDKITVLLNFPNNPTGYTINKKEAIRIAQILEKIAESGTNVVVACDDAYFGLFFEEDTLKESIFTLLCNLHPRILAVKLDGASKEKYAWGLRVAFITYGCKIEGDFASVYDALEKKSAGCIRGNISNVSHVGQTILLQTMQNEDYLFEKLGKFNKLKARAVQVQKVLSNPKYNEAWDVYPFNSGYFMCICLKNVNAEKLRVHLLDKYGVGLISIGEKDIRVAFSCLGLKDIERLFDIVLAGVKDLS